MVGLFTGVVSKYYKKKNMDLNIKGNAKMCTNEEVSSCLRLQVQKYPFMCV